MLESQCTLLSYACGSQSRACALQAHARKRGPCAYMQLVSCVRRFAVASDADCRGTWRASAPTPRKRKSARSVLRWATMATPAPTVRHMPLSVSNGNDCMHELAPQMQESNSQQTLPFTVQCNTLRSTCRMVTVFTSLLSACALQGYASSASSRATWRATAQTGT